MIDNFEIKCEKCGNIATLSECTSCELREECDGPVIPSIGEANDIKGTAIYYGVSIRIKFICLSCGYEVEVPVTQISLHEFEEGLRKKSKVY